MKKNSILILALFIVSGLSFPCAAAQFPIKIPKLPKPEKTKPEQPKTNDNSPISDQTTPNDSSQIQSKQNQQIQDNKAKTQTSVFKSPVPTDTALFLRETLEVSLKQQDKYWKFPNQRYYSNWIPQVKFEVFYDGSSRSRYTAEWFKPDGSLWFSESLDAGDVSEDWTVRVKNPYNGGLFDSTSTDQTGAYGLKITNNKTNEVVFKGNFNVRKSIDTPGDPQLKNAYQFFVDNDWNLALGYVGYNTRNWASNSTLEPAVYLWFKGTPQFKELEARLFYNNQEITSTDEGGLIGERTRRGDGCVRGQEICQYSLYSFTWEKFRTDNQSYMRQTYPNAVFTSDKPGEYTIKVFHRGMQVREAKFTIAPNGEIARNSLSGNIYPSWTLIPVKVMGTMEKWNSNTWKTDMFYGNPVAGFNVQ
jgi:hypothetical protein